jgi:catalase (peroxidase I)
MAARRRLLAVAALLLVAAPAAGRRAYPPLNTSTVARADAAVLAAFGLPAAGSYGAYCNPCPYGDAVGGLVRLPFHDAVGGGRPDGKGGPNGCIDPTFAGNAGLAPVVANLTAAYTAGGFDALMSKADFFVLAGNAAVRVASTLPPGAAPQGGLPVPDAPLVLPFRYGRQDDASCDGVDAAFLPTAGLSYAQVAAIFCARVGMSPRQLVAVMGAHTVGRARAATNGVYDGSWSGFSSSFSIAYYQQLLGVDWNQKDAPDGWSWLAAPPSPGPPSDPSLINLKASDVELVISPSGGCPDFDLLNLTQPTPPPAPGTACPLNTANVAALREFATNQTSWWAAFAGAWQVMTEFSYAPGQLQPPVEVPPPPPPPPGGVA